MREQTEIDAEITHVEYAQTVLTERLTALVNERDLLREDGYAKETLTKKLAEFFKAHGLYIVSTESGERSKDQYPLGKQIWGSNAVLIPFLKHLSKHRAQPSFFDTSDLTLPQKNDLRNFCHVLEDKGWVTYTQLENGFNIKPTLNNEQKSFVEGGWAEKVNLYLIDKTLKEFTKQHPMKHKLFWNTKLKRIYPASKHESDMELDLVVQVADRFYIFETKSGTDLTLYKWIDRTRLFDDGKSRFITCTTDETLNTRVFKPSRLFAMATIERKFLQMLKTDFPAPLPAIEPL